MLKAIGTFHSYKSATKYQTMMKEHQFQMISKVSKRSVISPFFFNFNLERKLSKVNFCHCILLHRVGCNDQQNSQNNWLIFTCFTFLKVSKIIYRHVENCQHDCFCETSFVEQWIKNCAVSSANNVSYFLIYKWTK